MLGLQSDGCLSVHGSRKPLVILCLWDILSSDQFTCRIETERERESVCMCERVREWYKYWFCLPLYHPPCSALYDSFAVFSDAIFKYTQPYTQEQPYTKW